MAEEANDVTFEEINAMLGGADENTGNDSTDGDNQTDGESDDSNDDSVGADFNTGDVELGDGEVDSGEAASGSEGTSADKIATLEAELSTLKDLMRGKIDGDDATNTVSTDEQNVNVPVIDPVTEMDFFADVDMDEIFEDKDTFKSWFKSTMQKTREADRDNLLSMLYKNIPGIIQQHVVQQVEGKSTAEQFYVKHADLVNNKNDVAKMANFVKDQYPDLGRDEFFEKVADMTRNMVGIKQTISDSPNEKPGKKSTPALNNKSVKAVSNRNQKEEATGMEKEIQELVNLM